MKQSRRILLILHILGWTFTSLLFLALDRRQKPDLVIVTGTVLAVLFVPVFFLLVLKLFGTRRAGEARAGDAAPPVPAAGE